MTPPAWRVVLATSNPGKLREFRAILAPLRLCLVGLDAVDAVRLPEEGHDYAQNAQAKARAVAEQTGQSALADDSGLEVDGLGGRPGAHSARYGGPGLDDAGRVEWLLAELAGRTGAPRRARFVCLAALAHPQGEVVLARGECPGRILEASAGVGGFGYDPVFAPDRAARSGLSMAELSADEKNRISHRAHALAELRAALLAARGPCAD